MGGETEPSVNEKRGHIDGGEVMICVWKLKRSNDNDGFELSGMQNCSFVFGFCDTCVDLWHCCRGEKRCLSVTDVICLQVRKHGQQITLRMYYRRRSPVYYIHY